MQDDNDEKLDEEEKVKPVSLLRISSSDLKLLSTMMKFGITPIEAIISIFTKRRLVKRQKESLDYIKILFKQGKAFSEVFANTTIGKGLLYISLISSAEGKGIVPEVLDQIAESINKNNERKNALIGILIYPAIVCIIVSLLMLALLLFIVPNILPVISMSSGNLPLATKILVYLSKTLKTKWLYLLIILVGFILSIVSLYAFRTSRILIEKLAMKTPVVQDFLSSYLSLGYTMAIYQSISATPDLESVFDNLSKTSGSLVYAKEFKRIKGRIGEGATLNSIFLESDIFPNIWAIFTKVAEQTSSYSIMFKNLHEYYKEKFDQSSKLMMRLAEPFLMIIIGLIVGTLAYGIMAPLYGIMNSLN